MHSKNIKIITSVFSIILFTEVILEFLHFGTLPFFAFGSANNVSYNEAGGVFGFRHNIFVKANSVFLAGYCFFIYSHTKRRVYLLLYFSVILIAVLYIARSTLISVCVVTFMVHVIFNKLTARLYIYVLIALVIVAFTFNKLYYRRYMNDQYFYETQYEDLGFSDSVSAGGESIYIYIATPVSNLINNIERDTFKIVEFRPDLVIRSMMPKSLGDFVFGSEIAPFKKIYYENYTNTSTGLPPFLTAFGLIGTLFILVGISLLMRYFYYITVIDPTRWILSLIFFNHMVAMSVFSTSFSDMVFWFPIVFCSLFPPVKTKRFKSKKSKNVKSVKIYTK